MHQHKTLEDTVYLWVGANDTSGSGADGASPLYDVRLGGAAANAIPTLSGSATLLTHANYPAGCHEIAIAATAANGFAAGNTYGVFCTLLVDSQNPTGFVGSFTLGPVPADITKLGNSTQSATDLKDFADTGYDPATHKVQGVVTTDTTTDVTNAVETDGDSRTASKADVSALALASVCTEARLAVLADWINGGRLDLILDIIAADTTTDIPTLIAALNNLSSAQANAACDTALSDYGASTHDAAAVKTAMEADGSKLTLILADTGTDGVKVADKTAYKLASDGLDQISAAEPTTKPTTFAGWLMWLIQRQRRSKLTSTTLTVEKEDGTVVTEQTVSDDGTTQQLGAPSNP